MRIVVGVDGSPHSRRALQFAYGEARARGPGVVVEAVLAHADPVYWPGLFYAGDVTHVPSEVSEEVHSRLVDAVGPVPDDVTVRTLVVDGPPAAALLDVAKGADMIVVGSRGRGGFAGLLLGSVGHQVVSHATCPVVIVPRTPEVESSEVDHEQ